MNKNGIKVSLHRETLRRLTVPDLGVVAGGATISCAGTCPHITCDRTICVSVCCP